MEHRATAELEKRTSSKQTKPKPPLLRWRGVLADASRSTRLLTALSLFVIAGAASFTQLGFVGVGLPGSYDAYAITLLAPIAVGALMLGVGHGTLLACSIGAILSLHSLLQPLDYYEIAFVSPIPTIILFTWAGFLLGLLFALALRKNPTVGRRIFRIILVCVFVSWLTTLNYMIHIVVSLTLQLTSITDPTSTSASSLSNHQLLSIAQMTNRIGSMSIQAWADALLMAVSCIIVDRVSAYVSSRTDERRLHTLFRSELFIGVSLVFLVTMGIGFALITEQEKHVGIKSLDNRVTYLCNQINEQVKRNDAIAALLSRYDLDGVESDDAFLDELGQAISIDGLLEGYTQSSSGIAIVLVDDIVMFSNDERCAKGSNIQTSFSLDGWSAIKESLETGQAQRVSMALSANDVTIDENNEIHVGGNGKVTSELGYLIAKQASEYTVVSVAPSSLLYANRQVVMASTTISTLILLVVVYIIASRLLYQVVVRRVDETNEVLGRITDGDLEARVDVHDTREFKSLSTGINTTVGTLKKWISEAESRMDAELSTAKAIQESALPRTFPPFPDITRFDIYASMKAAKQVGGDFYDFFLIDDEAHGATNKLGFVIADVSGKGVPAALFMMTAKTQVRNYLESGMQPGEAIENANRHLCEGNDAGMFVTLFAGVLDYETGHVSYVNAGHNPPLLWRNGGWVWLKDISGMPLGLFDGFPYDTYETDLTIGDQLLLYTDGVTEAMNIEGELFGEDRLEALVTENFYLHPRRLVQSIRRDLAQYTQGAEQSDDITMLALEQGVPPEVTATLIVAADVSELPNVMAFVHSELDRRLCPLKTQKQLDIALEELFVNVAHYAYPEGTPEQKAKVRIGYTYSAEPPSITVEIADDGIPYDPLAKPDAVTPDDIMEVPIGGLGILMAKQSVDEMTYERLDGSNIVTFKKKW